MDEVTRREPEIADVWVESKIFILMWLGQKVVFKMMDLMPTNAHNVQMCDAWIDWVTAFKGRRDLPQRQQKIDLPEQTRDG